AEVPSPAASSVPAIVSNFPGLLELPRAPATPSYAATFEAFDLLGPLEISTEILPPTTSELPKLP
ncbi:unnamed protein product, partial [Ilex paraguariensis]